MAEHHRSVFESVARQKIEEAAASNIEMLSTVFDRKLETASLHVGNAWTRLQYDGNFRLAAIPPNGPHVSLIFVQSLNGNTDAADLAVFGAGSTDRHLLYEGLSRVAVDAVLVGARTVHPLAFFSVWHPELIALRAALNLPRHPAQVVVSKTGNVDLGSLLFNVPDVPVFLIGGEVCFQRHAAALAARQWVRPVLLDDAGLGAAIDRLRLEHNIDRISAVGGPTTATRLVDEGVARDLYLTTGPCDGGVFNTPWYVGAVRPTLTVITRKQWGEIGARVVFEHIVVR